MKRIITLVIVIVMLVSSFITSNVYANDQIRIKLNGYYMDFDVMPVIVNSRTLVPMRGIFEALGADVSWEASTKTVRAFGINGTEIMLKIGDKNATVDGNTVTLDTEAQIVGGRTMVPVRFVSEAMGEEVGWDNDTRTVTIGNKMIANGKGLDVLKSTVHRPIPTEFTKSNSMSDLLFYVDENATEEVVTPLELSQGRAIYPENVIADDVTIETTSGTTIEVMSFDDKDFARGLVVDVTQPPVKDNEVIVRLNKTLEGEGKAGDAMLIRFAARRVSGGDDSGYAKLKVQVEVPVKFTKAVFEEVNFDNNWEYYQIPFTMIENSVNVAVRFGYGVQKVEFADFQIYNFGKVDLKYLPRNNQSLITEELKPDAQWRKDATHRIQKERKGNFKVVVRDTDGNIIPDAKVKADMFEHEFQFGSILKNQDSTNPKTDYGRTFIENFNSAVFESHTKPGLYDPTIVRQGLNNAKKNGIKTFRGHCIVFEKFVSNRGSALTPEGAEKYFNEDNKEMFDQTFKNYISEVIHKYPEFKEWDVANEIIANSLFTDKYGKSYVKEYMSWVKEISPETDVYYNENMHWKETYYVKLKELNEMGIKEVMDCVGLQSHYSAELKRPTEIISMYDRITNEAGFDRIKLTEYSCQATKNDEILQGNFTRDFLIASFSHPSIEGIYYWGHRAASDKSVSSDSILSPQAYAPFYTNDYKLKLAGEVFRDLVYNKWWTREEGKTNLNGEYTFNGYYGDYDVTAEANGITKTVMVAFHKGFDNVMEIIMDKDYIPVTDKKESSDENMDVSDDTYLQDENLPKGGKVLVSASEWMEKSKINKDFEGVTFTKTNDSFIYDGENYVNSEKTVIWNANVVLDESTIKEGDTMMLTFKARLLSGGKDDKGYLKAQLQVPVTFKKAIFNSTSFGREWTNCYMPFKMIEGATNGLGFRVALIPQKIEVKDIQLINYGTTVKVEELPSTLCDDPQ